MLIPYPHSRWKSQAITLFCVAVAVGTPSVALANVGTPLMWATALHMVFGNALIGVLEGTLLARVYRVPVARSIGLMILANYSSAWVGWVWLSGLMENRDDLNLYNTWGVVWRMVAAAYLATLCIEWPFVAGCFWGTGKYLLRSCGASLLIQSVSYILLFGWYGLASVSSLFTDMTIVSIDQISLPSNVRVYYIAEKDGNVYSWELSTGQVEKVFDLNSRDFDDCLSFEDSESKKGYQEIVALLEPGNNDVHKIIRTEVFVPDEDCPQSEERRPLRCDRLASPRPVRGIASKLGSALDGPWKFKAGFWPAQGLSGENSKTGARMRFALETPFVQWAVRHVIVIPSNRVLFQLGKRQICILDPETRKVAVLCFGRGAVAVLEQPLMLPKGAE